MPISDTLNYIGIINFAEGCLKKRTLFTISVYGLKINYLKSLNHEIEFKLYKMDIGCFVHRIHYCHNHFLHISKYSWHGRLYCIFPFVYMRIHHVGIQGYISDRGN